MQRSRASIEDFALEDAREGLQDLLSLGSYVELCPLHLKSEMERIDSGSRVDEERGR